MNKLSVLFVINSLEIGGAETFLMRLTKELSKQQRINPFLFLIAPEKNNSEFENYFIHETRIQIIPRYKKTNGLMEALFWKLNGLSKKLFGQTFYEELILKKEKEYYKNLFLNEYKIDLINSHLLASDIFAVDYLKPLINKPLVITSQGCYNDYNDIDTVSKIIQNIDGMTYVAEKNLNIFFKTKLPITGNKKLIYNGLPKPQGIKLKKRSEIGLSENDFVVGQISRSIETKGLEIAIKAVKHIVEENKINNLKLILVGPDNDYYTFLKEKYKTLDYIIFTGPALDPIEWVGLLDIGVLPSYFPGESCPSTIVEYLSCGKPVIATNIGEIPNMIEYEGDKAGIIITEKDSNNLPDFKAFANAINQYYHDRALFKKHSEIASMAFEKFLISESAEKYMEIFIKAISNFKS